MKISPRNRLIVTAVGVGLVVIIAAVVLVVPQFSRLSDLRSQIETAEQQAQQAETLLEQRRSAKDNAAATDAALLQLAGAVPENPDLPALIIELQDIAYDSDVQLRGMKPGELSKSADGAYVIVPLEFEVWGTWDSTVEFTQKINKMVRQIRTVEIAAQVLSSQEVQDEAVDKLPDYSSGTIVLIETYVIPAGGAPAEQAPPAPAPAQ